MTGFQTISPQSLMRRVGTADRPIIIDLRIPEDLAADARIIPGAILHDYQDLPGLLNRLDGDACVTICHKGKKISQGAAAYLRAEGHRAETLDGGMVAWFAQNLPSVPISALPSLQSGRSLWVTRHRPKIDRIACPWLIRRFIDRKAAFLFVPPDDVLDVADRFGATAFDVPGVPFSHVGPRCSMDAMIAAFGLSHGPLDRVADIVRAADTDHLKNVPQASGLLALSVGFSRMYKDDIAQLDAALPLYDALYRWARDGATETHHTDTQVAQ